MMTVRGRRRRASRVCVEIRFPGSVVVSVKVQDARLRFKADRPNCFNLSLAYTSESSPHLAIAIMDSVSTFTISSSTHCTRHILSHLARTCPSVREVALRTTSNQPVPPWFCTSLLLSRKASTSPHHKVSQLLGLSTSHLVYES